MKNGKDRSSKLFFSDNNRAREIVTLALRRMKVKGRVSKVSVEDPVVSFLDTRLSVERIVDKLFKVTLSDDESNTFCLIGLENQSSFDAHMLIRAGIASLLIYDWKLSLKEELKPVIMVVLNMSGSEWKGPTRLEEYFSKEDLELFGHLMVKVEMIVLDPHTMGDDELEGLETDLEIVLKVIKYKSDKKAFLDYIRSEERFRRLDRTTAKVVGELINMEIDDGGNAVCKAIEDLMKDSKAEGIIEGKAEGRAEGRAEGEANTYYKLRRDGLIDKKVAAERLGLSLEEYEKREDKFFS